MLCLGTGATLLMKIKWNWFILSEMGCDHTWPFYLCVYKAKCSRFYEMYKFPKYFLRDLKLRGILKRFLYSDLHLYWVHISAYYLYLCAGPDRRAVSDTYCLMPLEHWDREFESHSRHVCVPAFSCVGRDLTSGWSPTQGVLPTVQIGS